MRAESTITTTIAAALATLAVCAPSALAMPQDLRSPDNRTPVANAVQDLRSPDQRLAPMSVEQATDRVVPAPQPERVTPGPRSAPVVTRQDLRSPDAIDAGRDFVPQPVAPVTVDEPDGFQWGDAGIGAGVGAGLLALLAAGAAVTRRRHDHFGGTPAVS
jgi:hypothetical protein